MAPPTGYADLSDADQVIMRAFEKQYPSAFQKEGMTADEIRNQYAVGFLADPVSKTNPFAVFEQSIRGEHERPDPEHPPVLRLRPNLSDAELAALEDKVQQATQEAQKMLSELIRDGKARQPHQESLLQQISMFSYDAKDAGKILFPVALEMEKETGRPGAYVGAVEKVLLANERVGSNAETQAVTQSFHLDSSLPAQRLDETPIALVQDLLKKNRGVFIGEEHGQPYAVDTITQHLPELKAAGVKTLYIELDPRDMRYFMGDDSTRRQIQAEQGKSNDPIVAQWHEHMLASDHIKEWRELVSKVKAAGIEVVPYDHTETVTASGKAGYDLLTSYPNTFSGMVQRNTEDARNILETNPSGKFIVYGGSNHSGNIPAGEYSDHVGNQGLAYIGIDKQLGIPSVEFGHLSLPAGVYRGDGKNADYEVVSTNTISKPPQTPIAHAGTDVKAKS
jgi:hypothetical protein